VEGPPQNTQGCELLAASCENSSQLKTRGSQLEARSYLHSRMYSRQETSKLRQQFWAGFGQYMAPVLSAEGERINWINYKTGEKDIAFKMNADNKTAVIAIELTHADHEIQQIVFEHFVQLKAILHETLGEEWNWKLHLHSEHGKPVSRIYAEKHGCSIFKKEDWAGLISFFKPRIIALDEFWSQAKYSFESLR
jgi:hypothetical protein